LSAAEPTFALARAMPSLVRIRSRPTSNSAKVARMLKISCPWGRWGRRPARAGTAPHFAFGHGLGYKTWEYEPAGAGPAQVLDESDLGVTVVVRNTGSRAGREVVQA
jgi:hypothetical protein